MEVRLEPRSVGGLPVAFYWGLYHRGGEAESASAGSRGTDWQVRRDGRQKLGDAGRRRSRPTWNNPNGVASRQLVRRGENEPRWGSYGRARATRFPRISVQSWAGASIGRSFQVWWLAWQAGLCDRESTH